MANFLVPDFVSRLLEIKM